MRFVRARFPDSYPLPSHRELVYDYRAQPVIQERWPDATFVDACDIVHDSRFEVTIPRCDVDEFYAVMLLEGWAECCLGFEMKRLMPEHHDDIRRWLDVAHSMKENGYVPRPD